MPISASPKRFRLAKSNWPVRGGRAENERAENKRRQREHFGSDHRAVGSTEPLNEANVSKTPQHNLPSEHGDARQSELRKSGASRRANRESAVAGRDSAGTAGRPAKPQWLLDAGRESDQRRHDNSKRPWVAGHDGGSDDGGCGEADDM